MLLKTSGLTMLILAIALSITAQHLHIEKNDGGEISETISTIDKITLPAGTMKIDHNNSEPTTVSLYSIKKIYFDLVTETDESTLEFKPVIFPNPASNQVLISNLPAGKFEVNLFSIHGNLVLQSEIDASNPIIEIDWLSGGIYILKVNGSTTKIVKQ